MWKCNLFPFLTASLKMMCESIVWMFSNKANCRHRPAFLGCQTPACIHDRSDASPCGRLGHWRHAQPDLQTNMIGTASRTRQQCWQAVERFTSTWQCLLNQTSSLPIYATVCAWHSTTANCYKYLSSVHSWIWRPTVAVKCSNWSPDHWLHSCSGRSQSLQDNFGV